MSEKPIVIAQGEEYAEDAKALALRLGVPCVVGADEDAQGSVVLRLGADGLALCGPEGELRVDLSHMMPRLTQRNLASELLVKAAKVKGDRTQMLAVDATAGFGEDALLLAAAGFRVRMYERNPYIAELLADAMRRAMNGSGEARESMLAAIVARMELVRGDSIPALAGMEAAPDVILLDPMFPERTKSAAVRKKFQLLHHLIEPGGIRKFFFPGAGIIFQCGLKQILPQDFQLVPAAEIQQGAQDMQIIRGKFRTEHAAQIPISEFQQFFRIHRSLICFHSPAFRFDVNSGFQSVTYKELFYFSA